MNVLTKLKTMTDFQIQDWLKKVEKAGVQTLLYALLGADEEVKKAISRNMSERANAAVNIDLEKYKKMKISKTLMDQSVQKLEKLF